MLLERCDHNRFASQLTERIAAPVTALVPTSHGEVVTTHNNPPSQIEQAAEAFRELAGFLKEAPVITNRDEAKTGSGWLERTRVALKDAREERDGKTRPFLDRLQAIREAYDIVREKSKTNPGGKLESAYNVLRARLTTYANKVEAERIAEVERLRLEAEAKEIAARAAEAAEQEAIANSEVGEETDIGAAIEQADQAFDQFKRADRQVQVAERSVPVRFGSVMGNKSVSMRTYEVLTVTDAQAAFTAIGMTPEIEAALIAAAKKYREAFEELPAGITSTLDRRI
jgi:hypothetical protein